MALSPALSIHHPRAQTRSPHNAGPLSPAARWGARIGYDELVRGERHDPVSLGAVTAIVLVAEAHATLVERDEPAVRDRHPMGVARQIRPAPRPSPRMAPWHR